MKKPSSTVCRKFFFPTSLAGAFMRLSDNSPPLSAGALLGNTSPTRTVPYAKNANLGDTSQEWDSPIALRFPKAMKGLEVPCISVDTWLRYHVLQESI